MQLHNLTIREASEMLASKKISSVELTQAVLKRAHDVDPKIKSYVTITDDVALEQARQADERIAKGTNVTPLTGIPFAMKVLTTSGGSPDTRSISSTRSRQTRRTDSRTSASSQPAKHWSIRSLWRPPLGWRVWLVARL